MNINIKGFEYIEIENLINFYEKLNKNVMIKGNTLKVMIKGVWIK